MHQSGKQYVGGQDPEEKKKGELRDNLSDQGHQRKRWKSVQRQEVASTGRGVKKVWGVGRQGKKKIKVII